MINSYNMEESIDQVINERSYQPSAGIDDSELLVSPAKLDIRIATNLEEFELLKPEWNNLVSKSESTIFQTFEWNRVWWDYFGEGKELHIAIIYHADLLVGIVPLFLDTVQFLNRRLYSCLRFIGSTVSQPRGENLMGIIAYSDYLDAIIRPGYEASAYERLLQHFQNIERDFDEIILDEVPEDSSICHHMVPALEEFGYNYSTEVCSASPVIDLNCSWNEYLNNMSKKSRYNARRNLKMSTKPSHKVFDILEIEEPDEVVPVYDEMVKLHQQRWNNLGYPGTFAEERMYEFLKKISTVFYQKGWLQFKMAVPSEGGDECVAIDMILKFGDRVYMLHRAMDDESPYTQDSPGNVLLYRLLKEIADGGVKIFDFLRGVQEFKMRTADKVNRNKRIQIENPDGKVRVNKKLVKLAVRLKRRLKVERFQFNLFFKDAGMIEGLKNYYTFLRRRINYKMSDSR